MYGYCGFIHKSEGFHSESEPREQKISAHVLLVAQGNTGSPEEPDLARSPREREAPRTEKKENKKHKVQGRHLHFEILRL